MSPVQQEQGISMKVEASTLLRQARSHGQLYSFPSGKIRRFQQM
jgi:hypothetical protein